MISYTYYLYGMKNNRTHNSKQ